MSTYNFLLKDSDVRTRPHFTQEVGIIQDELPSPNIVIHFAENFFSLDYTNIYDACQHNYKVRTMKITIFMLTKYFQEAFQS